MSDHNHTHDHSHTHDSAENIRIAFFLNLVFTILEIIGGFWTNSMAILSDALHDLGDSLSLGLAWFLDDYSQKGPDKKFTFGYSRFSLLGALLNSLILIGGSLFILSEAVPRILNPETIKPKGMLLFAIGGIIANGLAAFKVSGGESLNEKVVTWHLLEDVLGWVAVFVVSLVLVFKEIPVLDPLLSVTITLYVLYNVINNLKEVLNVFLQGVPEEISIEQIEEKIANINHVQSVYHTHVWSLEGETHLLSTHVVVGDNSSREEIIKVKEEIRTLMQDEDIGHTTVEVDYESEDYKEKCN